MVKNMLGMKNPTLQINSRSIPDIGYGRSLIKPTGYIY